MKTNGEAKGFPFVSTYALVGHNSALQEEGPEGEFYLLFYTFIPDRLQIIPPF